MRYKPLKCRFMRSAEDIKNKGTYLNLSRKGTVNTGRHTKYLTYEIAMECRDFVIDTIQDMETWFIKL